jgi:hypothetical protein
MFTKKDQLKKKLNRKKEITRADKYCKLYIKDRDNWACINCGKTKAQATMSWGHLRTSSVYYTRWNELNIHCQCLGCNGRHEYDSSYYDKWFMDKYGQVVWNKLTEAHHRGEQIKTYEIAEIADYYEAKSKDHEHEPDSSIRHFVTL